ncbi:MAG: OsmC family protein [Pseudohongiellaceae bacterium]|jgi:putative redox protein
MKATIKWVDGAMFVAEAGSGHAIVVDGPPDIGGRNLGARPMELMLMGVGACSSVDVVNILKRGRQQVLGCEARVEATRVDAVPAVFETIHLHFVVTGRELDAAKVKRAVELSAEKYCSASIMLGKAGVKITHDYEVVDAAAPPADASV